MVTDRDVQRMELLRKIYEAADGSTRRFVDVSEIRPSLGVDDRHIKRTVEWFADRGYIQDHTWGGNALRLTPAGVDEAERYIEQTSSDDGEPLGVIAPLLVLLTREQCAQVERATTALQRALDSGELDGQLPTVDRGELDQVLVVIGEQQRSGRPRRGVVLTCLAAAAHILSTIALGVMGNGAYDAITAVMASL